MQQRRNELGKLSMPVVQIGAREAFDVPLEKIRLGDSSPYLGVDGRVLEKAQENIDMLACSIENEGQRDPIEIAVDEDGSFFVMEGELRVRAMAQLVLPSIKAFRPLYERKNGEFVRIVFQ